MKNGLLFGITDRDNLFCINAQNGMTLWTSPIRGGRGYGSIIDAGSVLLALTPAQELTVFEPSDKEFKQVVSYKVADTPSYAYPVPVSNRLYVKDQDAIILWAIE